MKPAAKPTPRRKARECWVWWHADGTPCYGKRAALQGKHPTDFWSAQNFTGCTKQKERGKSVLMREVKPTRRIGAKEKP